MHFHPRILPPGDELTFVLRMGPSVNHLYVGTGKGRTRDPKYATWADAMAEEVMLQRNYMPVKSLPRGHYCCALVVSPNAITHKTRRIDKKTGRLPPGKSPFYSIMSTDDIDLDNHLKAPLDLLHYMRVTPDDHWLYSLVVARDPGMEDGMSQVAVWSLEAPNG